MALEWADALDGTETEQDMFVFFQQQLNEYEFEEYFDADAATCLLCGAAVIAGIVDPSVKLPKKIRKWLLREKLKVSPKLLRAAIKAIDAATGATGKESELADLWDETPDGTAWRKLCQGLRDALSANLS